MNRPIILFDGVCNLCNSSVLFIIKRDKNATFLFAPLQSTTGLELMRKYNIPEEFNSFILIEKEKYYKKSTAALRVAKKLSGLWPVMYGFIIVPAFIRDAVYDFVGKNRYKWFGQRNECMMPTPELQSRFLKDPQ